MAALTNRSQELNRETIPNDTRRRWFPAPCHRYACALAERVSSPSGLVVIDEQHRFGVTQRAALQKDVIPLLVMTATPIPHLALST